MEKKIIWEKWVDPMGVHQEESADEFMGESEYTEYEKSINDDTKTFLKARPAALTSFGIIPINANNDPSKAFDFWVGHTNFYIGENSAKIISRTPGVEIFDLFSGYRFRISVGKCFAFRDVRLAISKRLEMLSEKKIEEFTLNLDSTLKDSVLKKITELKKVSDYWIIYILPNSKMEVSVPKDLDTFYHRKQILVDTRNIAGGIVITSDDFGV